MNTPNTPHNPEPDDNAPGLSFKGNVLDEERIKYLLHIHDAIISDPEAFEVIYGTWLEYLGSLGVGNS